MKKLLSTLLAVVLVMSLVPVLPALADGTALVLAPHNNGNTTINGNQYSFDTNAGDASLYFWSDNIVAELQNGKYVAFSITGTIPVTNDDDCFHFGYMQRVNYSDRWLIEDLGQGEINKTIVLTPDANDYDLTFSDIWNFCVYSTNAAGHNNTADLTITAAVYDEDPTAAAPTEAPTEEPTDEPTDEPTEEPTETPEPTEVPTVAPSVTAGPDDANVSMDNGQFVVQGTASSNVTVTVTDTKFGTVMFTDTISAQEYEDGYALTFAAADGYVDGRNYTVSFSNGDPDKYVFVYTDGVLKQEQIAGFGSASGFIDYETFFDNAANSNSALGSDIFEDQDDVNNHYRRVVLQNSGFTMTMPYSNCGYYDSEFDRVYEFDLSYYDEKSTGDSGNSLEGLVLKANQNAGDREICNWDADGNLYYTYFDENTHNWVGGNPTGFCHAKGTTHRYSIRMIDEAGNGTMMHYYLYVDGQMLVENNDTHSSGVTRLYFYAAKGGSDFFQTFFVDNINVYDYDAGRVEYGWTLSPTLKVFVSDTIRYAQDEDSIGWVSDIHIPYNYNPVVTAILSVAGKQKTIRETIVNGGVSGLTVRYAICVDGITGEKQNIEITCTVEAYDEEHDETVSDYKTGSYNGTVPVDDGYISSQQGA